MRGLFAFFVNGQKPGSLKRFLLAWAVSEIVALALVIRMLGIGGALLLTAATSVVGLLVLRRAGVAAAAQWRRGFGPPPSPSSGVIDSTATALGALLLILPGFVSDLAGLALATPSVRQQLIARFGGQANSPMPQARGRRPPPPDVIDLSPDDWTIVDAPRR